MLENIKEMLAKMAQNEMVMSIVSRWDMLRTPVILAGVICLLIAVFLFVRKKGGRIFFLILAIILGLGTLGMDKLKKYVEERKKEVVIEQVTTATEQTIIPEKTEVPAPETAVPATPSDMK
jgi:hypothetical protein